MFPQYQRRTSLGTISFCDNKEVKIPRVTGTGDTHVPVNRDTPGLTSVPRHFPSYIAWPFPAILQANGNALGMRLTQAEETGRRMVTVVSLLRFTIDLGKIDQHMCIDLFW